MTTYSHSKISSFEQCPLKFKFHYIDKIETEIEQSIEGYMGNMVHETLEKLYIYLKFQRVPDLNELISFYNHKWVIEWKEGIVVVRKDYNSEDYRKMGEKYITDYYNH